MHQHFRAPAASIIRVMEVAGSSQLALHIYRLTVAGPRWQATSLSPPWEPQISFYTTLNMSVKSVWCRDVAFDPLVSAARGQTVPHFIFFPPNPRFYRSQSFSLLWLLGILSQTREKVCAIFMCLFFWGFTSLLSVYLNILWMQKCLYRTDTKFELCFMYFLYNESAFSLVKTVVWAVHHL